MSAFQEIQNDKNIKHTVKMTFDVDLLIKGDWGYSQAQATVIESIENAMPLKQLQHMLISMRAHLEMNLTQNARERYAGINANELSREGIKSNGLAYDKVLYQVTAIKEDLYNKFINEYKENYGKETFDLTTHFKKRKDATLYQEVLYYFEVSQIK